jgi:hypothetical protein
MNTVSLQVNLPTDVYNAFIKQSFGVDINDFIIESIRLKLHNKTQSLNDKLIEGYKASNLEDKKILSDFSFSDLENWD